MASFSSCRRTLLAAASILSVCAAAPASGQGAPNWVAKPSPLDLRAAYPKKALDDGVGARVNLRCDVRADGRLESCGVASEEPAGYGFGASALTLTPKFRLGGAAAETGVSIPIRFQAPQTPPMREPVFQKPTGDYRKLAPAGPYWPKRALEVGRPGEAVIDCVVEADGRLSACQHVAGDPDFGGSTLRMAAAGWMTAAPLPAGVEAPTDRVWRFRVVFPRRYIKDTG